MTSANRRLFTWVDVDDQLASVARRDGWPAWLVEISGYWDALELTVLGEPSDHDIADWLNEALGPGSVIAAADGPAVVLESVEGGTARLMSVVVESVSEASDMERLPLWREPRVRAVLADPLPRPDKELTVPLIAFHSYKGGVGRTTHALAAALELAKTAPVLLVDADLEAPGLSWMFRDSGREAEFAYEDFLALLHSTEGEEGVDGVVALAAKFIANQKIGGIHFLPARRDLTSVAPARIAPADLLVPGRSAYLLSDALSALGASLGDAATIVDLRAGASELSSQILLDPRAERVFVTTASAQSLDGVAAMVEEIGVRAPSRTDADPAPHVVVTQFHPATSQEALAQMVAPIAKALGSALMPTAVSSSTTSDGEIIDPTTQDLLAAPVFSVFQESLLHMPASWAAVSTMLESAGLGDLMAETFESLQRKSTVDDVGGGLANTDLALQRQRLADFSKTLVYAEETDTQEFLATKSLRELVSAHRTELPVSVVVGAKGAGKTFTQLQMLYRGTWQGYAEAVGVVGVTGTAAIVPVMTSRNLKDQTQGRVNRLRDEVATEGSAPLPLAITDELKARLAAETEDRAWRKVWAWTLAASIGIDVDVEGAEQALLDASARGVRCVFAVDGLEDHLQNISSDLSEQRALRVLLQDVMEWLRSIRGRPFGLVVFVRRDLVRAALVQNSEQFMSRYRNFELAWDENEAVRLAAWVSVTSGAIETIRDLREYDEDELADLMLQVWGEKMGTAKSREARSRGWFLAALSDFKGGTQARDITLFVHEAATKSVSDVRWSDRLLTPVAMRDALIACSEMKIRAIGEETPRIGALLSRLRALPDEVRQLPITREMTGLDSSEIELLEENGIMFREEDRYWIPEIYRQGLGFRVLRRPRIVAVANLVRRRNNLD